MRHMETRYMWLQDAVAYKHVKVKKIKGEENASDVLTKAVPREQMNRVLAEIGQIPIEPDVHGNA